MQQQEAERAMSQPGVVKHQSVKVGQEGGKRPLPQQKNQRAARRDEITQNGSRSISQPMSIRRFALPFAPAQHMDCQQKLRRGQRQSGGLDGQRHAGEESEGRRRPLPVSADCGKEEGRCDGEADGHRQVALPTLGQAVAPVDQNEEARGKEAGEPAILGSHP